MKVLVTIGASYENIDQVRRITNFSTGSLGTKLANALVDDGHEVLCFKSITTSTPIPIQASIVKPFSNLKSLQNLFENEAKDPHNHPDIIFHVAALSDFIVKEVITSTGNNHNGRGKIPSSEKQLTLVLTQAPKIIHRFREWFPASIIVGWKYEVQGSESETSEKAVHLIQSSRADACVLNGPAIGDDVFRFFTTTRTPVTFTGQEALIGGLKKWMLKHNLNP